MSVLTLGGGYYLIPARFEPLDAEFQTKPGAAAEMVVSDDGTVVYVRDRLEISVRPMTDEELNRQFPLFSKDGGGPAAEGDEHQADDGYPYASHGQNRGLLAAGDRHTERDDDGQSGH